MPSVMMWWPLIWTVLRLTQTSKKLCSQDHLRVVELYID